MFSSCAACFIVCSQLNPMALARFGSDRVLTFVARLFLAATVVLTLVAFGTRYLPGGTQWWMLLPPIAMMLGCQGLNMPNTTVGALQRHAAHAGTASALVGMLGFCLAAVSGLVVGALSDETARPLAVLALIGGVGTNIANLYRRQAAVLR